MLCAYRDWSLATVQPSTSESASHNGPTRLRIVQGLRHTVHRHMKRVDMTTAQASTAKGVSQNGPPSLAIVQGWWHMVHRHGKRLNHEEPRLQQEHSEKAGYTSGKDPTFLLVYTMRLSRYERCTAHIPALEAVQPTKSMLKENGSE